MKFFQPFCHNKNISLGLIFLVMLLAFGFRHEFQGDKLSDKFWHWIDPVAGIMTFVTTLGIFYLQAKARWEDSLEERVSIDYVCTENDEILLFQVKNAYLAGQSDIRQWAQSLGGQFIGGKPALQFDLDWDEEQTNILHDRGKYYKHTHVKLYLTKDPRNEFSGAINQFLERKNKHSNIKGSLEELPIIWERN